MAAKEEIYILDSGVFLRGAESEFSGKPCVTVWAVAEEMKSSRAAIGMDRFLLSGLQILEPSDRSISEAGDARKKTQDRLSRTDILLVALALDFKRKKKDATVVSDDYGIQNLCKILGLKFMPLETEGITKGLKWAGRCRACGLKTNERICPNCGSAVKFGARVMK